MRWLALAVFLADCGGGDLPIVDGNAPSADVAAAGDGSTRMPGSPGDMDGSARDAAAVDAEPDVGAASDQSTPGRDGPPDARSTLSISPTSFAFSPTQVGLASGAKSFAVSNGGPDPVPIKSVAMRGAGADDFAIEPGQCVLAAIKPSGSCDVSVAFKPKGAGAKAAQVVVTSLDSAELLAEVSGNGIAAGALEVSPLEVSLTAKVGTTGAPAQVSITSTWQQRTGPIVIVLGGASPAQFAISSNTCGAGVAGGGKCSFAVAFRPTGLLGPRYGTVSISVDTPAAFKADVLLTGSAE